VAYFYQVFSYSTPTKRFKRMCTKAEIKPAKRLEELLQLWETRNLVVATLADLEENDGNFEEATALRQGSVAHWNSLRKKLLRREPLIRKEFLIPDGVKETHFSHSDLFDELPFLLQRWSATSRRVFTLSKDLQSQLEMTSLGQISLGRIVLPFPSFGINLPDPIEWKMGDASGLVDFLLIDVFDGVVTIAAVGPDIDAIRFMSPEKKHRLLRALSQKKYGQATAMVSGPQGDYPDLPKQLYLTFEITSEPLTTILGDDDFTTLVVAGENPVTTEGEKLPDFWHYIARVAFNLCLHLDCCKRARIPHIQTQNHSAPSTTNKPLEMRLITDEALVCAVRLTKPLDSREVEIHRQMRSLGLRKSGYQLAPGFRQRHFRRPWGSSKDPDSEQTVFIETYQTHVQDLPKVGIPVGSEVLVAG
jgi:hypothetical protein